MSVLKLGSLTPFNFVMELSQYASSLTMSEVKDPKVTVSDDYQAFTVGTQTMSLNLLHEGLQLVIEKVWMAYKDIVQCNQVMPEGIYIVNNLLKDLWGYSFLDERPFYEKHWHMFNHLVDIYRLVHIDYKDKLCWAIPQVKLMLAKCERMWDNILMQYKCNTKPSRVC